MTELAQRLPASVPINAIREAVDDPRPDVIDVVNLIKYARRHPNIAKEAKQDIIIRPHRSTSGLHDAQGF